MDFMIYISSLQANKMLQRTKPLKSGTPHILFLHQVNGAKPIEFNEEQTKYMLNTPHIIPDSQSLNLQALVHQSQILLGEFDKKLFKKLA